MLYEYRKTVRRRRDPDLREYADIQGQQGFISLYGYDEEAVDYIRTNKATYGLDRFPLYADMLYIDVDDDPQSVEKAKKKLIDLGVEFRMFMSGSPNSAHFHIPTKPMKKLGLNKIHLQWVEEHIGIKRGGKAGADNIYKASGIIRIEGTWHCKFPGERKVEIFSNKGSILDLTNYSTKVTSSYSPAFVSRARDIDELTSLFGSMLFTEISDGERNNTIHRLAKLARDIGMSYDETFDKLYTYNRLMVYPPLQPKEFEANIRAAYRGVI